MTSKPLEVFVARQCALVETRQSNYCPLGLKAFVRCLKGGTRSFKGGLHFLVETQRAFP